MTQTALPINSTVLAAASCTIAEQLLPQQQSHDNIMEKQC